MGLAAAVPIMPPSGRAMGSVGWTKSRRESTEEQEQAGLGLGFRAKPPLPTRSSIRCRERRLPVLSPGPLLPPSSWGLDAAPHPAHHQSPRVPQGGGPGAGIPQMALIQRPGDPAGRGQHVEVISPEKPRGEECGEGLVFACPAWVLSPPDKTHL